MVAAEMVSRWRPKMWGLPGGVKKGVMEKSDASESKGLKCGVVAQTIKRQMSRAFEFDDL